MSDAKQQNQNGTGLPKFIVLDVVFYGSSLNYDQGAGNYQELKKITLWNGKQHTFVSRYALRYSILQTGKRLSNSEVWKFVDGFEFERVRKREQQQEEQEGVIQPSLKVLLEGKVLEYPELNLFGYLITSSAVQNFREAPVKISHAISLTPFNYDNHFCANIWLARRLVEAGKEDSMHPNPFILEEHQTFYIYSVVIDVERLAEYEVYLTSEDKNLIESLSDKELKEKIKKLLELLKQKQTNEEEINKIKENIKKIKEEINNKLFNKFSVEIKDIRILENKVLVIKYGFKEEKKYEKVRELLKTLIKAIINLKREIKGRVEDLSPKVLVVGVYYDGNYDTYKDKILLASEYEEKYEEKVEENNGVKVITRRVIKLQKPLFKIFLREKCESSKLSEGEVLKLIGIETEKQNDKENSNSKNENNVSQQSARVRIFHTPDVEVKVVVDDNQGNQGNQETDKK